jgi:hypothetical protein
MTFVPKIFEKGARYRAKKSFMKGASTFIANEILVFELDGYSHYDDCFAYQFHSQTDGQTKTWVVFNNESAECWQQYFDPLDK